VSTDSEPSFGERLRHLRQAAGWSQEELAERARLTAAAIGNLERGERRCPYPQTVRSLADALGLEPADRAAFFHSVPRRGEPEAANAADAPEDAVRGADLVTTDVWTSMGFEAENAERMRAFENWQVDAAMMEVAASNALFMHCLPAHRGEEVSADVIDGPQSVVWDEAENRLHTQKALMEFLLLDRVNG